MKKLLGGAIMLASLVFFYAVLVSDLEGVMKFFASVVLLGLTSFGLEKTLGLENQYGLLLVRSSRGLEFLDRTAKRAPWVWNALADFGLVLGFGASSWFLFERGKVRKWLYLFGLAFLLFSTMFILPYILPVALTVIDLPVSFERTGTQYAESGGFPLWLGILVILFLGGFATATIAGLVVQSLVILGSVLKALLGVPGALTHATPGAAFLLPGINIDLFAGIVALIILLVVHEGGHGILARVGKVKLLSSGVVLFGVLPIGAFVDPDEGQLEKEPQQTQARVLVAGSTGNFLACFAGFALLLLFVVASADFHDEKVVVRSVYGKSPAQLANITPGTVITGINGTPVKTIDDFVNATGWVNGNETLNISTSCGDFILNASSGTVGVVVWQPYLPGWGWLETLRNALGLVFVLNFLIGSVNLLPLPFFDGYRIVSLGVKNKTIMKVLGIALLLCFLINFIPWLWQ